MILGLANHLVAALWTFHDLALLPGGALPKHERGHDDQLGLGVELDHHSHALRRRPMAPCAVLPFRLALRAAAKDVRCVDGGLAILAELLEAMLREADRPSNEDLASQLASLGRCERLPHVHHPVAPDDLLSILDEVPSPCHHPNYP